MIYYVAEQAEIGREVYPLSILSQLHGCDKLGADFEADGLDPFTLRPILLGLTDGVDCYVINLLTTARDSVTDALRPLLKAEWVMHNAKYDWKLLRVQYKLYLDRVWCTMVASQVLYNGCDTLSHSLGAVLQRHFGIEMDKSMRNSFINRNTSAPITDGEINYLVNDLLHLLPLQKRQMEIAALTKVDVCITELENPFLPVLAQMEVNGVRLNTVKWNENTRQFRLKAEAIHGQILAEVERLSKQFPGLLAERLSRNVQSGKYDAPNQLGLFDVAKTVSATGVIQNFNVGSTQQIQLVYNRCGATEVTSTGEDVLQQYVISNPDSPLKDFTKLLLEYRGYNKLISTYGASFLDYINPVTGKIHTDFSQCFTDTGRLSSSSPNLQNLPARDDIRSCFVPDSEQYVFVDCDFSGQELRLAASFSQDPMLLASFNEGLDLHSHLAQTSYRIITEDPDLVVTDEVNGHMRKAHKPSLFSTLYGGGPGSIARSLNIAMDVAKRVYNGIMRNLPKLAQFQRGVKQQSVQDKSIRDGSRYNRVKYFNHLTKKTMEDHQIERQSCNFPIQGSAAAMSKEAAIELVNYFTENNLDCQLKLLVHDEALVQIPADQPELGPIIKQIMEDVGNRYLTGVQMKASMAIEPFWQH